MLVHIFSQQNLTAHSRRASPKQSLGAFRKALEMYLTDYDEYTSDVSKLGQYTNITNLLKVLENGNVGIQQSENRNSYTITAVSKLCKERVFATKDNVWAEKPPDPDCYNKYYKRLHRIELIRIVIPYVFLLFVALIGLRLFYQSFQRTRGKST